MNDPSPRMRLRSLARTLYRKGWMEGTAGNLSLKTDEGLYITASGCPKGSLSDLDIVCIPLSESGSFLAGDRRPSAETSIHRVLYRLFPETGAVLHVHTVEAALVSDLSGPELELPPLEVLKGLGIADPSIRPALPVFENDLLVTDIAKKIGTRLPDPRYPLPALLIRHHGTTVWGRTLDDALRHLELAEFCFRALVMERSLDMKQEKSYQ